MSALWLSHNPGSAAEESFTEFEKFAFGPSGEPLGTATAERVAQIRRPQTESFTPFRGSPR
ncbi:MAG: hypothetical protein ACK6DS_03830 [Planctomycetota bacterium]|jgi:hypothetical protein